MFAFAPFPPPLSSPFFRSFALNSPAPASSTLPLTADDRLAFDAEVTQLNLRHLQWFALVGNVFLWGVFAHQFFFPFPLRAEANFLNGVLCASGLVGLGLIRWFRRHPVAPLWPRILVLTNAGILLGTTNAIYFAMLPAYGSTSLYVIGVLWTVVFFRLSTPVLTSLLAVNHAAFLVVLFSRPRPENFVTTSVVDFSGAVVITGFAGWLLYRAQRENFFKERTILAHNRELARLHRLELDEKITARLAEEKARLEMLRYQPNPHFLFNALTSVCSQLPPSLVGARATIERLTDFCQLTLFKPADADHPAIGDEVKLLRA